MSKYLYVVAIEADSEPDAAGVIDMHLSCDSKDCKVAGWERLGIQPGDLVEHRERDLDPREVITATRDTITLDLLGRESPPLPRDNYRVYKVADGAF